MAEMNNNHSKLSKKRPDNLSAGSVQENGQPEQAWWQPAVMMFARMSAWIVAPILLATLLGKWLDAKYNTEPWMFVGTVGVAFIVSMIGLVINAAQEYKKIEQENNKKSNKIIK